MNLFFQRTIFIAIVTWLLASSIYFITKLESSLDLEILFKVRGARPPAAEVVIVSMDDAETEKALNVGDQYLQWRKFHVNLIQELQRQHVALIIFDLHMIEADAKADPIFAAAIRESGNVLLADCVQRVILSTNDDFDGRKCSSNPKFRQSFVEIQGNSKHQVSDQLIALRKIPPTSLLTEAALDHAPFYLSNDPGNPIIHNSSNIYDGLAESPALPLLAWLYYLKPSGEINSIIPANISYSAWLSEQRRACFSVGITKNSIEKSKLESRIHKAVCKTNTLFLDYFGPARTLRMESYFDVYNGKVNDLQGKVVFIGKAKPHAVSNNDDIDYFRTPFSDTVAGNMSGVEIMATQFANLNTGRFILPLSDLMTNLLFLIVSLLIAIVISKLGWLAGTGVGLLLIGIYFGLAIWGFSHDGLWLPVLMPFMQLVFISLWDLLGWLPFSTVKRNVHGLCLATDIEGYTRVAEGLTPEQLNDLLAPYFKLQSDPVISNAGKINDIAGDAMMAVWSDLPVAKQRFSACMAALQILWAVERFNAKSAVCLPIRVGIFEGDMMLRPIYAGKKRFYRAIGNTLNIASRIEGVNKVLGTRILAAKSITDKVNELFVRPVGKFIVLGRDEPVELVEIVGRQQDISLEQLAMYQQFSLGLAAFQQGHWLRAVNSFEALLANFGYDGPTKYYLNLAIAFQEDLPQQWDGVLSLDKK